MALCRTHGARNIWQLPEATAAGTGRRPGRRGRRAVPDGGQEPRRTRWPRRATALLRVAQLGRAFGVYLIVCGQRIGSDLGPGVTALRSQLSGRICHRVNDPETANMTLGDMDPAALEAARAIPAETPGVAIVAGQDGELAPRPVGLRQRGSSRRRRAALRPPGYPLVRADAPKTRRASTRPRPRNPSTPSPRRPLAPGPYPTHA